MNTRGHADSATVLPQLTETSTQGQADVRTLSSALTSENNQAHIQFSSLAHHTLIMNYTV